MGDSRCGQTVSRSTTFGDSLGLNAPRTYFNYGLNDVPYGRCLSRSRGTDEGGGRAWGPSYSAGCSRAPFS